MNSRRANEALGDLVYAHLGDLYDHVRAVYPSVDVEATVDLVLLEAARHIAEAPKRNRKAWLFALTRRVLVRNAGEDVLRARNSGAVVAALRRTASQMTEWHAWADTDHVIEVVKSMSLPDQEVLRLITCMDDLDIESLASILEIDAADARATFERVTSTFRAIYAATDPDPGSLNSIGGES